VAAGTVGKRLTNWLARDNQHLLEYVDTGVTSTIQSFPRQKWLAKFLVTWLLTILLASTKWSMLH
jgi:hypothetical protein